MVMKKGIAIFVLAMACIAMLASCGNDETPTVVNETTAASNNYMVPTPEPTEAPTELAAIVPINPAILDPANYWFEVNGMRLAVGQTRQEAIDEGFGNPPEWQLEVAVPPMHSSVWLTGITLLENSQHSFAMSTANITDGEIAARDTIIYSIGVDIRTAREADSLVMFHDFQFGETTMFDVEVYLGTPTSYRIGGPRGSMSRHIYFFYGIVDVNDPKNSRGVQLSFTDYDFTLQSIWMFYSPF